MNNSKSKQNGTLTEEQKREFRRISETMPKAVEEINKFPPSYTTSNIDVSGINESSYNQSTLSNDNVKNILLLGLFAISVIFVIYVIYDNHRYEESLKKEVEALEAASAVEAPPMPYEVEVQATPKKSYEESVKEAWAEADKANAIIDNAQDEILSDYKKQAVEHIVSNGAGRAKVDTFILKNGKTVSCVTTVSDYGKAVDCH